MGSCNVGYTVAMSTGKLDHGLQWVTRA